MSNDFEFGKEIDILLIYVIGRLKQLAQELKEFGTKEQKNLMLLELKEVIKYLENK